MGNYLNLNVLSLQHFYSKFLIIFIIIFISIQVPFCIVFQKLVLNFVDGENDIRHVRDVINYKN